MPRMTFTSVANVPKNSPFLEKYCKVSWCLYPHAPEEVEKLYVMILNKHTIDARYFEILNTKRVSVLHVTEVRLDIRN